MLMTSDPSDDSYAAPRVSPRACPICSKPAAPETRPFCSPRCTDIDLHRWFSGSYAIPVAPEDGDDLPDADQEN
jgi:uncharacterized protein